MACLLPYRSTARCRHRSGVNGTFMACLLNRPTHSTCCAFCSHRGYDDGVTQTPPGPDQPDVPPSGFLYQSLTLLIGGISAGGINAAVFESIALAYEANPAGITLTGGIFFGAGSILAALLLAQCLDAASPPRILAVAALVPAA